MSDNFGGYVPREYRKPTAKEAFLQCGITDKEEQSSREGISLLNRRALKWLNNAASYAYATLNAILNFYLEEERKQIESILKELSLVLDNLLDGPETGQDEEEVLHQRIEAVLDAVGHAGNIFNNTVLHLPESMRKAVLEARDICDEAVKQPRIA